MKHMQSISIIIIICLHTVPLAMLSANKHINFIFNKAVSEFNSDRQKREPTDSRKTCDEDQLMLYLAEIQVINPENIINLSTLEDLTVLCKKVSQSLDTMDNYLKTCKPPHQNDLYIELIKGVDSLYEKLCKQNKFSEDFKHHYACFHSLHNDFEDCDGPADWNENAEKEKVCKAYHDIADCYYVKTAKLCGVPAATTLKELIMAVINSVVVVKCDNIKKNPVVPDAMPASTKKNKLNGIMIVVLALSNILQ